ncbi:hypothetical protein ACFLS4_01430 [Bacteroidota bacterium]
MRTLVRLIAFILLLGTTIIFILKIRLNVPISYTHLVIIFIIGAISLFWANLRGNISNK